MHFNTDKIFNKTVVLVPILILFSVGIQTARPALFKDSYSPLATLFGNISASVHNLIAQEDKYPFYLDISEPDGEDLSYSIKKIRLNNVKEKYSYGVRLPEGELDITVYYSYITRIDYRATRVDDTVTINTMITDSHNFIRIELPGGQ